MVGCPWKDNPIFEALPTEALDLEPFTHMGIKTYLPMACLLCPFLFEGECTWEESELKTRSRSIRFLSAFFGIGSETTLDQLEKSIEILHSLAQDDTMVSINFAFKDPPYCLLVLWTW